MGYCLTQNIQINWTASVQKNQKTMCTNRILRSAWLGHLLCALGLRCVFNAQRDATTQGFLIEKRKDPDQNGRMPTHGEWMLFLKGEINNELVSLELPFSIENHFCSKLSPNSVQLSATLLTIHIKYVQDWPTRLCDIEFRKSYYSRAIMHFML